MKRILFATAMVAALATTASAQDRAAVCPAGGSQIPSNGNTTYYTADACEKAIDLFNYMAPQLGTAIAGGSPVMGKGGTLGGLGHFSIGLRFNAVQGSLPQVAESEVMPAAGSSAQRDEYRTESQVVPMPVLDAAVGVFKGIPLGVTNVGGIDLLANVSYLRDFNGDNVTVAVDDQAVKIGYGVRVGLLQESLVSPGIALSVMRRDLPVVNIAASASNTELSVNKLDVQTTAWRVTASKSLLVFGLMLGAGQDRYDASAIAQGTFNGIVGVPGLTSATSDPIDLNQKLTRTNFFGGVTLNLLMFKLAAEVGQVSGGEIATYNSFDTKADDSRLYGSVGLRFGF